MSAYRLTEDAQFEMEKVRDGLHSLADLALSHKSGQKGYMAVEPQELWVLLDCLHGKLASALSSVHYVPGL